MSKLFITNIAEKNVGASLQEVFFAERVNAFVILSDRHNISFVDGISYGNVSITVDSPALMLSYFPHHHALVSTDARSLCVRRDSQGVYLLKTSNQKRLPDDAANTEIVKLELLRSEGVKLLEYLKVQSYKDTGCYPALISQLKSLFSDPLSPVRDSARDNKWETWVLSGHYDQLANAFAGAIDDMKKRTSCSPVLPVLSALLEKLHILQAQPYELRTTTGLFEKSCMASESARRLSFAQWPHMHYKWALPEQMAEAGFYHQPNRTGDDRALCFTCDVCLVCWEPSDEPWAEHERHSSLCPLVRGEITQNVPVDVTHASWPALDIGTREQVTVLSTNSFCDYISTATQHGEVVLWHIADLAQKCATFRVDPSDPCISVRTGYAVRQRKGHRVSWADTGSPAGLSAQDAVIVGAIREIIDISPAEIATEIGMMQQSDRGDLVVTAACCCGQPKSTDTTRMSPSAGANTQFPMSAALVLGCGILERKLRLRPFSSESPANLLVETGSSGGVYGSAGSTSSLVENLNTLNASVAAESECIMPMKMGIGIGGTICGQGGSEYRPFLLVYRITDVTALRKKAPSTSQHSTRSAEKTEDSAVDKAVMEAMSANSMWGDLEDGSEDFPSLNESFSVYDSAEMDMPLHMDGPLIAEYYDQANNNGADVADLVPPIVVEDEDHDTFTINPYSVATTGVVPSSKPSTQPEALSIVMQPPLIEVHLMQCVRMPQEFDSPIYVVKQASATANGYSLVVLLNAVEGQLVEPEAEHSQSAILIFSLVFSGGLTCINEQPCNVIRFPESNCRVNYLCMMPSELCGMQDSTGFIMAATDGALKLLSCDTGEIVLEHTAPSSQRYLRCAYAAPLERIGAITDSGSFHVLQFGLPSVVLESGLEEKLGVEKSGLDNEFDDADLLINEPITWMTLRRLREATISERDYSSVGLHVEAPSSWLEIQSFQRVRKNLQYGFRECAMSKCWQLTPDMNTWREHFFEVTLPTAFNISHLDFGFVLASAAPGILRCPDVEVSLVRRTNEIGGADEIVAGPISLASCLDPSAANGCIQFSWASLLGGKTRTVCIRIRARSPNFALDYSTQKTSGRRSSLHKTGSDSVILSSSNAVHTISGSTKVPMAKYPTSIKGVPSGFKVSSTTPQSKTLVEQKKAENLKGCNWIQEISITAWKFVKTDLRKERKLRLAMVYKREFHEALLDVLSLRIKSTTFERALALELLVWIVGNLESIVTTNARGCDAFVYLCRLLSSDVEHLFYWCYLRGGRDVARQMTTLIVSLLRCMELGASKADCSEFVNCSKMAVISCWDRLADAESSASLFWLSTLVSILMPCFSTSELLSLQQTALRTLLNISLDLKLNENAYHGTLINKFFVGGFPLELEMFDLPTPFIFSPQRIQPVTFAEATTGSSLTCYTVGLDPALHQQAWWDIMSLNVSFESEAGSLSTGVLNKSQIDRRRLLGLIEVEPLQFVVHSASEGMKVENVETGDVFVIGSEGSGSSGSGPISLPDFAQKEAPHSGNPALAHAVTTMQQQVQSLLSKQMQLISLQNQKQKLQGKLQEHAAALAGETTAPVTQESSASTTFCPTTPKTTPFMTPTPLSPSHLSPMNSESHLNTYSGESTPSVVDSKSYAKLLSCEMLKPPAMQALVIERMNSGARRFVVLDFKQPVLLTDVLIPQCGEVGCVSIDVWLRSEQQDRQHLVICEDISRRSLVLSQLQPPALCRYVKIYFIGRHGIATVSTKVPLGCYYGYSFVQPQQLVDAKGRETVALELGVRPTVAQLQQLAEDLLTRYTLACSNLTGALDTLNSAAGRGGVLGSYRDCMQLKIQWNLVKRTLARLNGTSVDFRSTDKLFILSEATLELLGRLAHLETRADRNQADIIFGAFCTEAPARLRALTATYLLQNCVKEQWWGGFLVDTMYNYYRTVAPSDLTKEQMFLYVTFLARKSVKACHGSVIEAALECLTNKIDSGCSDGKLIAWLLYYVVACFDIINYGERWDFLLGEYAPKRDDQDASDSGMKTQRSCWATKRGKTAPISSSHSASKTALIKAKYGGAPSNAEPLSFPDTKISSFKEKGASVPVRKTSAAYEQPQSSAFSSGASSVNASPRTSRRQVIKLDRALCLRCAKAVLGVLLRTFHTYSNEAMLTMCKLLSCLGSATSPRLHIVEVFTDEDLEQFLKLCTTDIREMWVSNGLVSCMQDLLRSEMKCQATTAAANEASAKSGKRKQRLGSGAAAESMTTSTKPKFMIAEDIAPKVTTVPSTSGPSMLFADAELSGQGACSSSAVATMDLGLMSPDSPADAHQLIQKFVNEVQLLPLDKGHVTDDVRMDSLKKMCSEVLHAHFSQGYSASSIPQLLQGIRSTEHAMAKAAPTEVEYLARCEKFTTLKSGKFDSFAYAGMPKYWKAASVASSASAPMDPPPGSVSIVIRPSLASSSTWTPPPAFLSSMPMPGFSLPPPIFSGPLSSISGTQPSSGSSITATEQSLQQVKNELSLLCEQLQQSSALFKTVASSAAGYAPLGVDDTTMTDVHDSTFFSGDLDQQPSNTSLKLDASLKESASSSSSETDELAIFDPELSGGTTPAQYEKKTSVDIESDQDQLGTPESHVVEAVGEQDALSATLGSQPFEEYATSLNVGLFDLQTQQSSLVLDNRLESNVTWRSHIVATSFLWHDASVVAKSLRSVSVPKNDKLPAARASVHTDHVSSFPMLTAKFSQALMKISNSTNDDVENLLRVYWHLVSVAHTGSGKSSTAEVAPSALIPLIAVTPEAISALMKYLAESFWVADSLWCIAFRVLTAVASVESGVPSKQSSALKQKLASYIAEHDAFELMITQFVTSICSFSTINKAGPVILTAFSDFVNKLHMVTSVTTTNAAIVLQKKMLQCLVDLLVKRKVLFSGNVPCDVLHKVIEFLFGVQDYATLGTEITPELIAQVVNACVLVAREYLKTCPSSGDQASLFVSVGRRSVPDSTGSKTSAVDRKDTVVLILLRLSVMLLKPPNITANDQSVQRALFVDACVKYDGLLKCLLEGLSYCLAEEQQNMTSLSDVNMTTIADGLCQLTCVMGSRCSSFEEDYLPVLLEFLRTCVTFSKPLLAVCIELIKERSSRSGKCMEAFMGLGGYVIVTEQLISNMQKMLVNVSEEGIDILRQSSSLGSQLRSSLAQDEINAKRPAQTIIDGVPMMNFATTAAIRSSSPMASGLSALLSSVSTPHRRARTAAWSYHFYPTETWLDLSITLPYAVCLHEVQLRTHAPTLQTCPEAIQIELASDKSSNSYRLLGPPVTCAGRTKIRINTRGYRNVVQMVRVHLKRPVESDNISISQILLLGCQPFVTGERTVCEQSWSVSNVFSWLRYLQYMLLRNFGRSFRLPELMYADVVNVLVRLMLRANFTDDQYVDIENLVCLLNDLQDSGLPVDSSVLPVLFKILSSGEKFSDDVLCRVVNLCFTMGTAQKSCLHDRLLFLLSWIVNKAVPDTQCTTTLSALVWSVAGVLWNLPTYALGIVVPILDDAFVKAVLQMWGISSKLDQAVSHMLCAVCHLCPEHVLSILRLLSVAYDTTPVQEPFAHLVTVSQCVSVMRVVFQSPEAAQSLIEHGFLGSWVKLLTNLCQQHLEDHIDSITQVVTLFADLCVEPVVKEWFNSDSHVQAFWAPLVRYVCMQSSAGVRAQALEAAMIVFFQRCLNFQAHSQSTFARILCQMVREFGQDGLSSCLQNIILRLLLEDERLQVCVVDKQVVRAKRKLDYYHPRYGCSKHVFVQERSVTATCQQILDEMPTDYSLWKSENAGFVGKEALAAAQKAKEKRGFGKPPFSSGSTALKTSLTTTAQRRRTSGSVLRHAATPQTSTLPSRCLTMSEPNLGDESAKSLTNSMSLGQLVTSIAELRNNACVTSLWLHVCECTRDVKFGDTKWPMPLTLLEAFAREDGLALLANYLNVHNMSSLSTWDFKQRKSAGVDADGNPLYYTDKELALIDELAEKENMYAGGVGPYMELGPAEDWVNIPPPNTTLMQFSAPSDIMFDMDGAAGGIYGARAAYAPSTASNGGPVLTPAIVSFTLLLKLPSYATALVSQHRKEAQWFLRLALGVWVDSNGENILAHAVSSKLPTLPFDVLSVLYHSLDCSTEQGRLLRECSFELGVLHLVFAFLQAFSHQEPRDALRVEEKPEILVLSERLLAASQQSMGSGNGSTKTVGGTTMSDDRSHVYWAKGTGFGTGSTMQTWNMQQALRKQKEDEEHVACLLKVVATFVCSGLSFDKSDDDTPVDEPGLASISCNDRAMVASVFDLISRSCLIPALQTYLRNDSVLDISRHVAVYEAVLKVTAALALCEDLRLLLFEPREQSVVSLLKQLKNLIDIYASRISSFDPGSKLQDDEGVVEESLFRLVRLAKQVYAVVVRVTGADGQSSPTSSVALSLERLSVGGSDAMTAEERYCKAMKDLQFVSMRFFEETKNGDLKMVIPFNFENNVRGTGRDLNQLAPRVRRLAQEAVTLSTSLPLSASSSVFVCCAEERLDVMKVLITGPLDTPYSNGCFEFDVYFPPDYPNSPMSVNLQTTGGHSVRFNPNLYNDGKVCLSILNTWHGRPEERWNAQTSSLLQVLVSIQSLILVADPYFNEPGYERSRSTAAGQQASLEYDANIRQACVRWAMLEMLRSPPICFKEVVQRHFWFKRDEIVKQIERWIAELEEPSVAQSSSSSSSATPDKPRVYKTLQSHAAALKRHFVAIKEEFAKLKTPTGVS